MPGPYFQDSEFRCHGLNPDGTAHDCGLNAFDPAMRAILEAGREKYGKPIVLASACRCDIHNADVGGARRSAHRLGPDGKCHAGDIYEPSAVERAILHDTFYALGIRRFEVSDEHLHIDNADAYLPTPILTGVNFTGRSET